MSENELQTEKKRKKSKQHKLSKTSREGKNPEEQRTSKELTGHTGVEGLLALAKEKGKRKRALILEEWHPIPDRYPRESTPELKKDSQPPLRSRIPKANKVIWNVTRVLRMPRVRRIPPPLTVRKVKKRTSGYMSHKEMMEQKSHKRSEEHKEHKHKESKERKDNQSRKTSKEPKDGKTPNESKDRKDRHKRKGSNKSTERKNRNKHNKSKERNDGHKHKDHKESKERKARHEHKDHKESKARKKSNEHKEHKKSKDRHKHRKHKESKDRKHHHKHKEHKESKERKKRHEHKANKESKERKTRHEHKVYKESEEWKMEREHKARRESKVRKERHSHKTRRNPNKIKERNESKGRKVHKRHGEPERYWEQTRKIDPIPEKISRVFTDPVYAKALKERKALTPEEMRTQRRLPAEKIDIIRKIIQIREWKEQYYYQRWKEQNQLCKGRKVQKATVGTKKGKFPKEASGKKNPKQQKKNKERKDIHAQNKMHESKTPKDPKKLEGPMPSKRPQGAIRPDRPKLVVPKETPFVLPPYTERPMMPIGHRCDERVIDRKQRRLLPPPPPQARSSPTDLPVAPSSDEAAGVVKPPLNVGITGASSKTAAALLYLIGHGSTFGAGTNLNLHLMDVPRNRKALYGVARELELCGMYCVNEITVSTDYQQGFEKADVFVMLTPAPVRAKTADYSSFIPYLLYYKCQGLALESYAKRHALVVVCGDHANTLAAVLLHYAPSMPRRNVTTVTTLAAIKARAVLASHLQVPASSVCDVFVWGNSSPPGQYVDGTHAKVAMDEGPMQWLKGTTGQGPAPWLKAKVEERPPDVWLEDKDEQDEPHGYDRVECQHTVGDADMVELSSRDEGGAAVTSSGKGGASSGSQMTVDDFSSEDNCTVDGESDDDDTNIEELNKYQGILIGHTADERSRWNVQVKSVREVLDNDIWLRAEFPKLTLKMYRPSGGETSHARAIATHLRLLWCGTPPGQHISMGVAVPAGEWSRYYQAKQGIFFSFPVTITNREWTIKEGFYINGVCVTDKFRKVSHELQRNLDLGLRTILAYEARWEQSKVAEVDSVSTESAETVEEPAELTFEERRRQLYLQVVKKWARQADDDEGAKMDNRRLVEDLVNLWKSVWVRKRQPGETLRHLLEVAEVPEEAVEATEQGEE